MGGCLNTEPTLNIGTEAKSINQDETAPQDFTHYEIFYHYQMKDGYTVQAMVISGGSPVWITQSLSYTQMHQLNQYIYLR